MLTGLLVSLTIGMALAYIAWAMLPPGRRRRLRPMDYLVFLFIVLFWFVAVPFLIAMAFQS